MSNSRLFITDHKCLVISLFDGVLTTPFGCLLSKSGGFLKSINIKTYTYTQFFTLSCSLIFLIRLIILLFILKIFIFHINNPFLRSYICNLSSNLRSPLLITLCLDFLNGSYMTSPFPPTFVLSLQFYILLNYFSKWYSNNLKTFVFYLFYLLSLIKISIINSVRIK